MHTFRVWAPTARSMEVELEDGQRVPMAPEPPPAGSGGGWWSAPVERAGPGMAYRFAPDGGVALPDPRSAWQPLGIYGPSVVVDHDSFPWTDRGWRGIHLPAAVLYEVHVGTFSDAGTFAGVATHLDHLVDLGIDALELMPVVEFSGERGWGYDGVDLYAPHHAYGGPDGLKALVDACHARGLGVVLDVVYNHLGPVGNYLDRFGPYFTDRYRTPWGPAVNLDGPGSDEVRAFVVDNACMWLRDYHCDGLRLDAVHAIVDTSATHLCEELTTRVEELGNALGRRLFVIGESDRNDPRLVRSRQAGGYGLDAQWSDDFHHALHAVLTGEQRGYYADFGRLGDVARALRHAYVYDGRYSPYRGRTHGRPAGGLAGTAFLGYLQNHDQVGNRAGGERASALMSRGRLAVGIGLVLTSPFIPLVFQGEEWGAATPFPYFTAHEDPDLGRAVAEGRRREFAAFGWDPEAVPDPQAASTFEAARLDWRELEAPEATWLLGWTRELLCLRRGWPELADGALARVAVAVDEAAGWLRMARGRVVVVANVGAAPVTVPVAGATGSSALARSSGEINLGDGEAHLPPDSLVVLAVAGGGSPGA
ncbi:MAG TPA: malto-oligosyltrehalose trehalohydrolase [Acidimicrobiales bacterium]|nr:malto-oligosyltrehalose trehalohydrolase [Acidimicrobiales bacterium]